MDNEDNTDKLTEARSSKQRTLFQKMYFSLCPCLITNSFLSSDKNEIEKNLPYHKGIYQVGNEMRISQKLDSMMSDESSRASKPVNNTFAKQYMFKSAYEHAHRLLQDYDEGLDKSTIKKWHSYSIYQYREDELQIIGSSKGRILCKISCVRIQPSPLAKKKTNKARSMQRSSQYYNTSNFDRYWNKRYLLFQKFDEGISLDDESWYSVTPEAIAEHIAGKIRCDTILDGFSGVGGNALKFSNTCSRVIANQSSRVKLRCLQTNVKVYCVENLQMLNQNFLELDEIQADVVFLAPPFGPQQNLNSNSFEPENLNPPLDKIFSKAIEFSKNIVMLLPPNMNIRKLGEVIAKVYIDSKIPSTSCSIVIQKIFYMSQMKYIAVYLGSVIQKEISLNDELFFIYNYLKEGSEKKQFSHKKVIRQLREQYGMINLLNFVFELDKVQQSGTLIEKMYTYIRENNLINSLRLQKLRKQQLEQYERYSRKKIPLISDTPSEVMEQQKYMGDETDKERTLSYYSGASGVNKSRMQQEIGSPNKNIVSSFGQHMFADDLPRANTIQFCTGEDTSSQVSSQRHTSNIQQLSSYK